MQLLLTKTLWMGMLSDTAITTSHKSKLEKVDEKHPEFSIFLAVLTLEFIIDQP